MDMSCEFAPRGTKRQFEDEYKEEEGDGVYSDDDEDNNNVYDYSDHSDCERLDGTRVDPKVMEQYKKELKESDGFDITVYAGGTCNQVIVPMIDHLNDPESKQEFTDLCNLALDTFNSKNATKYEFVDILWVTASFSAGIFYYFTFQATHTTHGLNTFQALVWDGVAAGDTDVEFCRIKQIV